MDSGQLGWGGTGFKSGSSSSTAWSKYASCPSEKNNNKIKLWFQCHGQTGATQYLI